VSFKRALGKHKLHHPYALTDRYSDAILIDATLNTLSILIRARPHVANRILNVILNFNPLKQANSPMTPKLRVMVKSMEKTTRLLLIHINKRYANYVLPNAGQMLIGIVIRKTLLQAASSNMLSE
jgi:hypothetical protein